MEWVEELHSEVVGLDTAPIIYFIEENSTYLDVVRPFFQALDRGEFRVITSTVSLLEVLVHPFRLENAELAQQYRDILLNTDNLTTLSLSPSIAEEAAQLRAEHNIRAPDAIQMATALYAGASVFVSNDSRLPSLPTLETLLLDDLKEIS